jgi:hypothetical protein
VQKRFLHQRPRLQTCLVWQFAKSQGDGRYFAQSGPLLKPHRWSSLGRFRFSDPPMGGAPSARLAALEPRRSVPSSRLGGPRPQGKPPVKGRGARQGNRQFLDRSGVGRLPFFRIIRQPARRFMRSGRRWRFARNENEVKSLKTNDTAKCPISHHQSFQWLTTAPRSRSFRPAK